MHKFNLNSSPKLIDFLTMTCLMSPKLMLDATADLTRLKLGIFSSTYILISYSGKGSTLKQPRIKLHVALFQTLI